MLAKVETTDHIADQIGTIPTPITLYRHIPLSYVCADWLVCGRGVGGGWSSKAEIKYLFLSKYCINLVTMLITMWKSGTLWYTVLFYII